MARRALAAVVLGAACLGAVAGARAESDDLPTPPRLSVADGTAVFWRPGAEGWAPAQVNTPLAPGDALATGHDGSLEVQVSARAFVRAWGDTQLAVTAHDARVPGFRIAGGHVALDLREVEPGHVVAVDTPHAQLTLAEPGYYRADVTPGRTALVTRRAGRATLRLAGGEAIALGPDEAAVVEGEPTPAVRRGVAPDLDAWDRWNVARTDELLAATAARYVPAEVYGAADLDRHGDWRLLPTYGAVWFPRRVAAGWAPYSAGRWLGDPRYGWTWLDTAPWGWAPYHYGRWVFLDGAWAWAPGPIVVRPVWVPALVAFFGAPGTSISWVALGWGEPVTPWWGPVGFVGRPWWGGWGGPRLRHAAVHRNVNVANAVVAVRRDHFGRRAVDHARVPRVDVGRLEPVRGPLAIAPPASARSVAPGTPTARPDPGPAPAAATPSPRRRPEAPRARDGRRAAERRVTGERPAADVTPALAAPTLPEAVTPPTTRRSLVAPTVEPPRVEPPRAQPSPPAPVPARDGGRRQEIERPAAPGHQPGVQRPAPAARAVERRRAPEAVHGAGQTWPGVGSPDAHRPRGR
jgi:hypothetical protein